MVLLWWMGGGVCGRCGCGKWSGCGGWCGCVCGCSVVVLWW